MESDLKTISRGEFIRNLSDSRLLLADGELHQLLGVHPADADAAVLARQLIETGKLTAFQIESAAGRRFDILRIAGYEVLELLGKGGMGTVYKARHRRMKRIAAIKILSPEVAKQSAFVQRFQREVETIAQLHHPNVVMAYDAGESSVGHFLVMEFVNGEDLACQVQRLGPMKLADAIDCTVQAARGLESTSAQNLIHRDIKPANLLKDVAGVVKVADLGLARVNPLEGESGSSLTQAGGIVGTVDYMPPEQALDSTHIDRRADIYSLGCTLYFLLTGRPPYAANSLMALLLQHRDAAIPSLCAVGASVPKALDTIFRKMVAKKPEDRFASMSEVIRAIEEAPLSAGNSSDPAEGRKPVGANASLFETTVAADSAEMLKAKLSPGSDATPPAAMPSVVGRLLSLTVVVVEPSRTQAGIIRKYLQSMGIEKVLVATSGQQAHQMAKQDRANVVISAMHLSDMTGVQLAQAIRADSLCSEAGFILASSESDGGESSSLLGMPRTVLMHKPFDLGKLAQSIAEATGLAASEFLSAG